MRKPPLTQPLQRPNHQHRCFFFKHIAHILQPTTLINLLISIGKLKLVQGLLD